MNISKETARYNARKLGIPEEVDIPDFSEEFKGSHNRQDYQKRFYPEFYKWILRLYPEIKTHSERMYLFLNGMAEPPRCPTCGNYAVFNSNHRYSTYCSKVCGVRNENTKEKARMKKISRTPEEKAETIRKRKKTNLDRFGTENPMELKEIKDKQKRTTFERFGVEYSLQSEYVREKGKKTNIERIGVENPMQSEEIRRRHRESTNRHYGVENPFQSEEIKNKIKSNNQQLYGCDWNCQRIENRKESEPNRKFRELLEKFGISYEKEFPLGKYIYDFRVGDVLFEVSPSITHNVQFNPFGGNLVTESYHQEKCLFAKDNGYNMVEIWDWDNPEEILLDSVKYKFEKVDASELEVCFVPVELLSDFICIINDYENGGYGEISKEENDYWNTVLKCDNSYLVGLHKDGTLYSAMVAVPDHGMEIKMIKSIPGIEISGGLRKMVDFLIGNCGIDWCNYVTIETDLSKNFWKYLESNGFTISSVGKPEYHLYSLLSGNTICEQQYKSIVDSIDYDVRWNLENSNVVKTEDEVKIMVKSEIEKYDGDLMRRKYVKVYDCGKATYIWKKPED